VFGYAVKLLLMNDLEPQENTPPAHTVALASIETPTLTKAELADLLFENLGLNKRESKDMVEAFFDIIQTTLIAGDDVKLRLWQLQHSPQSPPPGPQPAHR
jgi:integration host factor subunit alpha